jgi:MscS family membrane protein
MKSHALRCSQRWAAGRLFWLVGGLTPLAQSVRAQATNATNSAASAVAASSPEAAPRLPTWLEQFPWLQYQWLGNPLWQYAASLIYIVLAFYAAKLVDLIFRVQLRKLTARTRVAWDDLLVELVRGPIKVITFVVLLHVGLRVFAWPDWAASFISNGLKLVVAASITYVALKLVDLGMNLWRRRLEAAEDAILDSQLLPIISKSAKVFVVVVAALVTTQNLGMNVTGLLASLSIGGLAVGLAAQDTLSNLFGAVAMLADKPFRVGDRIQLDSIDGVVENIGLRSTRIRNLDGHLVTVPNRTMANANLTNISKRPNIKTVMNIGVTYDTPAEKIERAMQVIEEIYRPHPRTSDLIISFNKFESSSLNILVVHWWDSTDFKEYLLQFQKLNLELKRRFDAEGINFAFPSQTVYLRQDSKWQMACLDPRQVARN